MLVVVADFLIVIAFLIGFFALLLVGCDFLVFLFLTLFFRFGEFFEFLHWIVVCGGDLGSTANGLFPEMAHFFALLCGETVIGQKDIHWFGENGLTIDGVVPYGQGDSEDASLASGNLVRIDTDRVFEFGGARFGERYALLDLEVVVVGDVEPRILKSAVVLGGNGDVERFVALIELRLVMWRQDDRGRRGVSDAAYVERRALLDFAAFDVPEKGEIVVFAQKDFAGVQVTLFAGERDFPMDFTAETKALPRAGFDLDIEDQALTFGDCCGELVGFEMLLPLAVDGENVHAEKVQGLLRQHAERHRVGAEHFGEDDDVEIAVLRRDHGGKATRIDACHFDDLAGTATVDPKGWEAFDAAIEQDGDFEFFAFFDPASFGRYGCDAERLAVMPKDEAPGVIVHGMHRRIPGERHSEGDHGDAAGGDEQGSLGREEQSVAPALRHAAGKPTVDKIPDCLAIWCI